MPDLSGNHHLLEVQHHEDGDPVSLKLVLTDGVLAFPCPRCDKLLEVGVHIVSAAADPERKVSPLTGTHYGHRVEFVAEAPNLHARLWGHMVREHDGVNPYLTGVVPSDDGLSMWEQEFNRIQERKP